MKTYKRIAIIFVSLLFAVLCTGCNNSGVEKPTDEADKMQDDIANISELIETIAESNSSVDVGDYITPSESDFIWEAAETGVALTGYNGSATSIEVPSKLGGEDVTEIRGGAFADSAVIAVKLPDTVINVCDNAFYYCITLVEIQLGAKTEIVGTKAFEGCIALKRIELNEGLIYISDGAFANCTSLTHVDFPDSLTKIGAGAFGMSGITEIVIPGSVESIGTQAFTGCKSLKQVSIENGTVEIGEQAFEACEALTRVDIPTSVTEFGIYVFLYSDNAVIYSEAGSAAEAYANENGVPFQAR
ncbi:MAG: leucine-rich repeat domain-containing protein [Roseburia sp.]|nr:leucine-rich repeat domain-containing protein [Roseburia sp.]